MTEGIVVGKKIIDYTKISEIVKDDKYIIFWDTCSLLYYNSLIDRRAYKEYQLDEQLLGLIMDDKVYSFTSSVVLQEFNKHHLDIKCNEESKEQNLKNLIKEYGKAVGGEQGDKLAVAADVLNLSDHMDDMVKKLWSKTYVVDENSIFQQKAHNRVMQGIAPAKIKQEYKDCYIWETFLTLCDSIPYKEKAFFMTENTDDFCGKKCKTPLDDIQNDLNIHNGEICTDKNQLWVKIAKGLHIIP